MNLAKRLPVLAILALALLVPQAASAVNPVSFSPGPSLGGSRDWPATAPLPDGKVLVAGGDDVGNVPLATALIYDPKTNSLSPTGSLGEPRFAPASAVLADGRVLIAGGNTVSANPNTAEIFSPTTRTFSPVAGAMVGTGRFDAGAARLPDGRVLIVGGYNGGQLATTEFFDPASGTFTAGPSMSVPRDGAAVVALPDGRVLIAGGFDGANYLETAEVFSPATNTFSPVASMATKRYAPAGAALPGGRVLVAGGNDGAADFATSEIFSAATNSFTAAGIGPMAAAREDTTAAPLADGRVLVVGGYNSLLSPKWLSTTEILSVPSNAFKAKLKGKRVKVTVTTEGTVTAGDPPSKKAKSAKKKKKKLIKTASKTGGPGTITVKVKPTAAGKDQKKLKVAITFTPQGGLPKTIIKKLKQKK